MTEFSTHFLDDEPDDKDRLLRSALADFQTIVSDFMMRAGTSMNDLAEDELRQLVARIDPHLKFELQASQDIYKGMPIIVYGDGAFLLTDPKGAIVGIRVTSPDEVITGIVNSIQINPVPTREIVLSVGKNEPIPTYDLSLSAVIIIENAKFYSAPDVDGEFEVVHDLAEFGVAVPLVYNMKTRVADITP